MSHRVDRIKVPSGTRLKGWTHDPTETYPNGWVSLTREDCEDLICLGLMYPTYHVPWRGKLILEAA